jgi:hypothetical protein
MICESCKQAADLKMQELHAKCPGKTWCVCQHRKIKDNGQRTTQR